MVVSTSLSARIETVDVSGFWFIKFLDKSEMLSWILNNSSKIWELKFSVLFSEVLFEVVSLANWIEFIVLTKRSFKESTKSKSVKS